MRRLHTVFLLIALSITIYPANAQSDQQCFRETGQCISGHFRQFWEQNGGLAIFGFPITAATNEVVQDTGQRHLVQWFERSRFELHPENNAPYDVMLSRLGDTRLRQLGHRWEAFVEQSPSDPHYFPETRHAIDFDPFWKYWRSHGHELDGTPGTSMAESIALFGFPLSRAVSTVNANGDLVLAQWFERARLEYHPNNPPQFQVLAGLIGSSVLLNQQGSAAEVPEPTNAVPEPVSSGVELVQKGFGQNGQRIGYGFTLHNKQDRIAERVEYTVHLLDGTGAVVGTDSHFLRIMYPNERVGVGNEIVVSSTIKVASVEVQLGGGRVGSGIFADFESNPLSTGTAAFRADQVHPRVTGTIQNRLPIGIGDIRVNALAYDNNGMIIGGGFGFVNFVSASGSAEVDALVTVPGTPSRVELYPIVTVESDLGEADEDER